MKKLLIVIIIFLSVINIQGNVSINSPEEIRRVEDLLEDNYLEENDKAQLSQIKEKLCKFELINQDEKEFIRQCHLKIIRNKLGDVKFEEYCKLIAKRNSNAEFTQPERYRLYELEKELKSIK